MFRVDVLVVFLTWEIPYGRLAKHIGIDDRICVHMSRKKK